MLKATLDGDARYRYILLSRHQSDCAYFLGFGNAQTSRLWGKSIAEHIQNMKDLYNSFSDDEKPRWLSYKQILKYEWRLTQRSLIEIEKLRV